MSLSIVLTDAEQRATLAAVRSLGRAGHRVHVCSTQANSLSSASRFAGSASVLPDPLRDPDHFAAALATVAMSARADVVLPMSEAALLAVLPERGRFACLIPFTTIGHFERICDKTIVLSAAERVSIAVPAQRVLATREDTGLLHDMPFPIVLKPARSVSGDRGARIKTFVHYARDASERDAALASLPDAAFPLLCQQRIEGPGTAISLLIWNGEVKAAFAHRRLREKPPSGGVSVLRESIPLDANLLARSVALLREFEWQGVAMVEFKVDNASGRPYLMEINGRFWGSLQLAIDAAVDFPGLLVDCATQKSVTPVLTYPSGVRTRWEWGDVDHLLARLRHSPEELFLPQDAPSRRGAVAAFVRGFAPSIHSEVFSRDDMGPFFRESANWFRGK